MDLDHADPDRTAPHTVSDTLADPTLDLDGTSLDADRTEETTAERAVPGLGLPRVATPAYLVEVRRPRTPPTLFAIRATLVDAQTAAAAVHPGVAEVVIHEVPLPCDAATLARRLGDLRTWTRDGDVWRTGSPLSGHP